MSVIYTTASYANGIVNDEVRVSSFNDILGLCNDDAQRERIALVNYEAMDRISNGHDVIVGDHISYGNGSGVNFNIYTQSTYSGP